MSGSVRSRREFIKVAGLSVIGARVAHAASPSEETRAPAIRLGVASYSLRNFPRDRAIAMLQSLGASFVNIKSVHLPYDASPAEIAAARREFESAGLHIVGGGTITFEKDSDDDVRRYFEYAKAAGMPLIVGTCARDVLPRVERFAKQYDITVAIHTHGPEDRIFPSPYEVLSAVHGMDARMGVCMDVGHTARTGVDVVKAAADAGARLLDIHAKDLRDLRDINSQCIVGEGKIPIAQLFRQLAKMRYAGFVNLEYEIDADDPVPGMKQSLAFMRGVVAGMG